MSPPIKYRIERSAAYHGRPVVQGWFADSAVWADIGEPCRSRTEAEAKLAAILAAREEQT